MSAYKKNARVQRDEQIDKRGKLKPRIGNGQRYERKNRREYFQHPSEVIVRMDGRPRENNREPAQQEEENGPLFTQHSGNPCTFMSDRVYGNEKASPKRG